MKSLGRITKSPKSRYRAVSVGSIIVTILAELFYLPNLAQFSSLISTDSKASVSTNVIEFEGASNFLSLLRSAYEKKRTNPLPHCLKQLNATEDELEIRRFNRAIEIDWIGRNISSIESSWSSIETASCHFVGLAFPPTKATIDAALSQKTSQCDGFKWERDRLYTCRGINYGGTLGANSVKGCVEESSGGYIKAWNKRNSNDVILQCLKHFLQQDEIGDMFDMNLVEANAANFTKMEYLEKKGYGASSDVDWSTRAFLHWSKVILANTTKSNSDKLPLNAIEQLSDVLKNCNITSLCKCVDELRPPSPGADNAPRQQEQMWQKYGVHLSTSTMQQSPSSLLRSFPASIQGVLPPPPTAISIYSKNALLGNPLVNVESEFYFPGCTQYWNAASPTAYAFLESNEEAKRNGTMFAYLAGSPKILRNHIIKTCALDELKCPFRVYDMVIDVTQVYCGGFFHWIVEIWPRLAPFLDALLSKDMPKFIQYYTDWCSTVRPVFAKEVIAPTEGIAHSPLLNYWNLVAMRQKVLERFEPIKKAGNRTVLVLVRDASRRGDGHIYNETFLKELSDGLPINYNIVPYRSSDTKTMSCIECQVRAFMAADVIIGSHGAGLSLTLFAPAGALILERIAQEGDSGVYAELPFILGMKYFPMHSDAGARAYRDLIIFADGY